MKRLFFALWPDDESRHQIDQINQKVSLTGIRKLIPDNLHITLVFLGNVDDETAAAVEERAAEIIAPQVTLKFDELDFWPKPKVLCLTCRKQPKAIYELVNALTTMVSAYPIRLDPRPFRAHITLARKATVRPDIQVQPIIMQFDRFVLVRSSSTEAGVKYDVLASWPLQQTTSPD